MPSISVNIVSGRDDGWANSGVAGLSTTHFSTHVIYVGVGGTIGTAREKYVGQLRFLALSIPQGATINSATLTMIKANAQGAPLAKIYGNNVDNAGAWGTTNRVKNITKTAHSTPLDTADATSVNDVTNIVQDIINRIGWISGNNLAFGMFNLAAASGHNSWGGYAYLKGPPDIPNLSVTYTQPASGQASNAIWFGAIA